MSADREPQTSGRDASAVGRGQTTKNTGLRGVTVTDTRVSHVDGEAGRLIYRGYDISVLAERSTYEEVAYLLLFQDLPGPGELASFSATLARERRLSPWHLDLLRAYPSDSSPIDVLQSLAAALSAGDPRPGDVSKDAMRVRAVDLVAKFASLTAAWHRIRQGLDPIEPSADVGHAADFLRMLQGRDADPAVARDLDVALILHADHSLNASTFTARTVASTRAHLYAAVSSALGALSGELHGGANARVMQMLHEIGDARAVEDYVRDHLDRHEPVMGMGHAVYRTDDPRALILTEMSRHAGERAGDSRWYELTVAVQAATQRLFRERKGSDIYPNVDMYSASLYHVLGLPSDLFTPVFAVSRIAGWGAHVIEERFAEAQEKPQLYRPQSDYVGQYCGEVSCAYVPLEDRATTA